MIELPFSAELLLKHKEAPIQKIRVILTQIQGNAILEVS